MKQLVITGYGKIENNLSIQESEKPEPRENEVLVEVYAAGVNPIDYKIVEGAMKPIEKLAFPAPIGFDVSGKIIQKGAGVNKFEIGDEVYARVPTDAPGTFAEYVAVDHTVVVMKPAGISFEEASSIPLVALTTVQAFEQAGIKTGDKVLIHAGSGGVGTFAIQYAKSKGAYVYTTTSTKNVSWVKDLGADRVIDYKKENYLEIVTDADIVYDTLGGNYTKDAFAIIKKGGTVVSIIGDLTEEVAKELGLNGFIRFLLSLKRMKIDRLSKKKAAKYKYVFIRSNASQLEDVTSLIEQGIVKPIIDMVFDFDCSIAALVHQKSGRAKGKIVIRIKE